jgi:hypothetical protein
MCRNQKGHREVNTVESDYSDDDDFPNELFMGSIETVHKIDDGQWSETITLSGINVNFQLDTGAKCNVLSLRTYKQIN